MRRFTISGSKDRSGGMMMSMLKRFFWGMGAVILTYVVVPKMRRMAKPMVNKSMSSMKDLAERGKQTIKEYKSNRESEKADMAVDTSLEQVQVESDVISSKINSLQKIIDKLQSEINHLRERR